MKIRKEERKELLASIDKHIAKNWLDDKTDYVSGEGTLFEDCVKVLYDDLVDACKKSRAKSALLSRIDSAIMEFLEYYFKGYFSDCDDLDIVLTLVRFREEMKNLLN